VDQELRRKFDLEFAVLKHGTAWWEEPLLLASMDTAKLLRHREKVAAASFDLVVVDEAHRLKNQKTLAWKFLDRLAPRYLLLLTATPVQNDLHELYNLIQLVRPGFSAPTAPSGASSCGEGTSACPRTRETGCASFGNDDPHDPGEHVDPLPAARGLEHPLRPFTPERELYDNVTRFVRRVLHAHREPRRGAIKLTLLTLQKEMGSSTFAAIPP